MRVVIALLCVLLMLAGCNHKTTPTKSPKPSQSCYTTDQGVRECGLQSGVQPAPSK